MDIQKLIGDLVAKLTGNKDLIAKFTSNPLGAIKDLLGVDLDPSQLDDVVKGVTGQLGDITGDAAKQAGGILDKNKSLFKTKKAVNRHGTIRLGIVPSFYFFALVLAGFAFSFCSAAGVRTLFRG